MIGKRRQPIMYVDSRFLQVKNEVQRDIDLEKLVNEDTRFYDDPKTAYKQGFLPLSFAVTVRSVYSNQLVQTVPGKGDVSPRFYVNLTDIQQFPHRGYDLIMYLSSLALFKLVDYKPGFDDVMMHTEFQPIGLYNPNPEFISPIIYSHIYIDDSVRNDFSMCLNDRSSWVSISYAKKTGSHFNLQGLLDTLIEVKKEEDNNNE